MTARLHTAFTFLFPVLLAILVIEILGTVYPVPHIFIDTYQYLVAGRFDLTTINNRTPFYGWLMLGLFHLGGPMLIVRFQLALWMSCILAAVQLTLKLTESRWRAGMVGVALVICETAMMVTLPANWFLLTDAPYAEGITLGLLLILLGGITSKQWPILLAALLIGLANVMRPVMIGAVLASFGIMLSVSLCKKYAHRGRIIVLALVILWTPSAILSGVYHAKYGTFNLSTQFGQSIMQYTLLLTKPEDRVFADPELNRAFHQTLNERRAPEGHRGEDPFLLSPGKWLELSKFYSSIVGSDIGPHLRTKISALSEQVMLVNIRQHPMEYTSTSLHFTFRPLFLSFTKHLS